MTDEEVVTAVDAQLWSARKLRDGRIGRERRLAYQYYFGEPYGNEVEGQSKVNSQLVMEVIDTLMPDIMRVFCGGEKVVEFVGRNANDVPLAEQATEVCNYVFYTQNPGFLLLYNAVKDALLQKTGVLKYWWLDEKKVSQESYQGLNEGQLLLVTQDPQVEIVQANAYPDPNAPAPTVPAPQAMQGGMVPGQPQTPGMPSAQPMLYDVVLKRTKAAGHICIESVPPDELLVSDRANTVDPNALNFIAHETHKTLSELVEMGYDMQTVLDLPSSSDHDVLAEDAEYRRERLGQTVGGENASPADPMQRVVRYTESWALLDVDGDGISELRKICKVGTQILANEVTERVQLAIITPKPMPHEFYGVSLADDTCDLQLAKASVTRQLFNGMYQTTFPRSIVVEGMATVNTYADLMAPDPGKPIRVKAQGAVTPFQIPFDASAAQQVLEWIEQEVEGRTPVSRDYQGLDPRAIDKTATATNIATNRSQSRVELICRIFAETGFKDLFRGILWLLGKYQQEPLIVKISGDYKPIDPRAWTTEYDMTVNVGLGTGNKGEQLQMLQTIGMAQQTAVQFGGMGLLVTPKNIYNLQAKVAQLAGFKDPGAFWTEPSDQYQPPPPKPDPAVQVATIKAQADAQNHQADLQADAQKFQAEQQAKAQQTAMDSQAKAQDQHNSLILQQSNDQRQAQLDQQAHEREIQRMTLEDAFKREQMNREFQFKQWETLEKLAAQKEIARSKPAPMSHGAD